MYVVETNINLHGPFRTAREAAQWAIKEFPLAKWSIRRLVPR